MNNITVVITEAIARRTHSKQTDKLGVDYIEHPAQVAERVLYYSLSPEAVEAAELHDVLEDTPVTARDPREAGIHTGAVGGIKRLATKYARTGQLLGVAP